MDQLLTPTRRMRTRLPADRRREQILAAAANLFLSRGYGAVGIDSIGAAAGISGPAIYRHFRGKHDILQALLHDAVADVIAAIDRMDVSGGTVSLAQTLARHAVSARMVVSALQEGALPAGSEQRRQVGLLRARLVKRAAQALRAARAELSPRAAKLRIEGAVAIVRLLAAREPQSKADRRTLETMVGAILDT